MEFVKSERGKTHIALDGYLCVKQKGLANGVISYECEKRSKTKIGKESVRRK